MKRSYSLSFHKIIKAILILSIIFLIIALAIFPEKYSKSTYSGVLLWAVAVMPSLLPYFFLTAILTKTNCLSKITYNLTPLSKKLFRLKGISFYAFFMSVLSGYPVGSKITSDLYQNGLIGEGEAKRLSLLASTSGPLFIIGAVGANMFFDKRVGFILYIAHVLSAIFTSLIFRNKFEPPTLNDYAHFYEKSDNALYECVYSSVISVLIVGGFVSVFFVISEILSDFYILYPITKLLSLILTPFSASGNEAEALSIGLIEFTKGAKMLAGLGVTPLTVSLANFIITFGGISAIMQSLAFLKNAKVSAKFFILGKFIQAIISFVLCYLICLVFL